jgi:hypothetical protein
MSRYLFKIQNLVYSLNAVKLKVLLRTECFWAFSFHFFHELFIFHLLIKRRFINLFLFWSNKKSIKIDNPVTSLIGLKINHIFKISTTLRVGLNEKKNRFLQMPFRASFKPMTDSYQLTPISLCLLLNIRPCRSFSSRRLRSMAACSRRSTGKSSLYIF